MDNKDDAIQILKERTFDLIIIEPLLPTSFDGEDVIEAQRQFYSININTPIVIFTDDIELVSRVSQKYEIHPETKHGPITKIITPLEMACAKQVA